MYLPVALSAIAACAPNAAELQAGRVSAAVDQLRSDLSRTQAQVSKLAGDLALMNAEHDADREARRTAFDDAAAISQLQVVRLQPAAEPPPLQEEEEPLRPPKILRLDASPDRATDMFRRALLAYQQGAGRRAYNAFDSLLKQYPEHPDADSARFWMGVCKFEEGDYKQAISQFVRLRQDAPGSSKMAEALLKTGLAYEHLQQSDKAKTAFAELIASYPSSAPAELARTRLTGRRGSDAQL